MSQNLASLSWWIWVFTVYFDGVYFDDVYFDDVYFDGGSENLTCRSAGQS